MYNFMNELKNYFIEELQTKYDFDIEDIIIFYEALKQNQDKKEIQDMIKNCENTCYYFAYKDKYGETGGYIKGEITININNKSYNYKLTLDNYMNKVIVTKNECVVEYAFKGEVEDVKDEWEEDLLIYKINKLKEKIKIKEQYILESSKEISILEQELESLSI